LQELNYLLASDIETFVEINNVLTDTDIFNRKDLQVVEQSFKVNVTEVASTLEKFKTNFFLQLMPGFLMAILMEN